MVHPWFRLMLVALLCALGALVTNERTDARVLVLVLTGLAAAWAGIAFAGHVGSRLRFGEVVGLRLVAVVSIVCLPVVAAITLLEDPFPPYLSNAVAGPIEETAKLALPVAMYFWSKRFRGPRVGLALVLASAAALGVYEAVEFTLSVHRSSGGSAAWVLVYRPLWDAPLHMVLTGTIGAVLWRRWHRYGRFQLDGVVVGTVAGVMALHSLIDWSSDLHGSLGSMSVLLMVPAYLWFKVAARQLVPPDAVATVPPGWRPSHLRSAQSGPSSPKRRSGDTNSGGTPQGSTRTSEPSSNRPGRTTAA